MRRVCWYLYIARKWNSISSHELVSSLCADMHGSTRCSRDSLEKTLTSTSVFAKPHHCFSSTLDIHEWTTSHLDTSPRIHQQVDRNIAGAGATSGGGCRGDVLVPPWDFKGSQGAPVARNPEAKRSELQISGHSASMDEVNTPNTLLQEQTNVKPHGWTQSSQETNPKPGSKGSKIKLRIWLHLFCKFFQWTIKAPDKDQDAQDGNSQVNDQA